MGSKTFFGRFAVSQQAIRFLFIGGGITLFDWVTFTLLSRVMDSTIAFITSYVVAVFIRFWLDRRITFVVKEGSWRWQLVRYFLSCAVTFCISFITFQLATGFGSPQFLAKVFSTGCGTILGFVLFKFFVFARSIVWAGSSEETRAES
jgi:putative flippase GtrA